jgi:hypothetical protein
MVWKILFWLYCVPFVLLVILSSLDVKWHLVDWISDVAVMTGILILYLYAYNKNLGSNRFRYFIVSLIIVYWIVYVFYLDPHTGAYPRRNDIADILFNIVVVLPVFIADVLYARRRLK